MGTGALILAAGLSSRMGAFKPLMKIGEKTMIEWVMETFLAAGCEPIVIVTGRNGEELQSYIQSCISSKGEWRKKCQTEYKDIVQCIHNPHYATTQMLDSAKLGMAKLQNQCERFFFTPADIPLFTVNTLEKLRMTEGAIIKPVCQNKSGHPMLLSSKLIPEITAFSGNGGLKQALIETKQDAVYVEVEDEGILKDADTKEEFKKLVTLYNNRKLGK